MPDVTVAIPVRDGGELLGRTLSALARQTVAHELLVCDSGSRDGSAELARELGARVIEIEPRKFGHGATRNLLMREAAGAHVALLTQDAEPADERWLERLLGGFELTPDVGLVYGPYRPRPEASVAVRLELERWFGSLAPTGEPTVERLAPEERGPREANVGATERGAGEVRVVALVGRRGFFTDANACIARAAWERVRFREVAYAEDRVLAIDMLRAGYAKAFVPSAAVWHSHDYTALQQVRRCFDEWRGLREVYGWREPADPRSLARGLRGELAAVRPARLATLAVVSGHHVLRLAGALLGSRADRLPPKVRRGLSLERRAGFEPLVWDAPAREHPTDDRI
ncbi:MAG TPA: glycosyltransferase family 2 protein [Solirubrobacteraceae bacterium]|jgi:rhamnosyltransferase